jgi:replicative DNA helicase
MTSKVPPQAIEIENAVLGAILLEKEAIEIAAGLLSPEMFYSNANQIVFSAMYELHNKSQQIDYLTIQDHLSAKGELQTIGGVYYLTTLTNAVVSSAHIERHCRKLVEKYILRELIRIGGSLYAKGFDETTDPFVLIEENEQAIHSLSLNLKKKDLIKIDESVISVFRDLEEKRNRERYLTGVSTGFKTLDKNTCGWQPTDLMILAARPKCGKTAFALNLSLHAAQDGVPVAFFSMEMSADQLTKRLLANSSSIYLQNLRDARLNDEQMRHLFEHGIKKVGGLNFYIDDTAALSVADFKAKARRMVKKFGVGFIVLDYLQLMQPDAKKKNQNREQEVAQIARQLKIAAKELKVPLLALSQLSREIEKRGNHVPQLSDLRESGAIEQDADMVMFLYRPEVEVAEKIILNIAAYRNGDLSSIEFDFNGGYQRFTECGGYVGKAAAPVKDLDGFPGRWKQVPDQFNDDNPV